MTRAGSGFSEKRQPSLNWESIFAVIDTSTNTISTTVSTGASTNPLVALTSPDGTRVYVETGNNSDLIVYDASSLARLNTIDFDVQTKKD